MICTVQRLIETSKSIVGELTIDGQRECFTLEPSRTTPFHPGHPCIPAGEYEIILSLSPTLKRMGKDGEFHHYVTPEVLNVPGRTAIRIHIGNFPKDTLGCTLLGLTKTTDFVGNSRTAFDRVFTLMKYATDRGEKIMVTYKEPE